MMILSDLISLSDCSSSTSLVSVCVEEAELSSKEGFNIFI